ncbi:MAG: hypothetical protein NT166_14890 [Candidatus Aminicenantes bacterium]|nr:hypothetical protein [Candidatus Aminicenantes bacterium]
MRIFLKAEMKELFDEASAGIANSKDNPMVLEKVAMFGYTRDGLIAAETDYINAESLYLQKAPKVGLKLSLSIQVRKKIDDVYELYMLYVNMLRRDLREDTGLLHELLLLGERDHTVIGKIKDAKAFYKNCLDHPKLLPIVAKVGLTTEMLQLQMSKIAEVENDKNYRAILVKEAEKTTEDRNKVVLKLYNWWMNYKSALIYVFKDDPQQLEAFKIKGYSIGYVPRKSSGDEEEPPEPPESPEPPAPTPTTTPANQGS